MKIKIRAVCLHFEATFIQQNWAANTNFDNKSINNYPIYKKI